MQYTAQPLPGASLALQRAGPLNATGAVRLAAAPRADIAAASQAGTLRPGDGLPDLAASATALLSALIRQCIPSSGLAGVGGTLLVGGEALFTRFQPIYDSGLT